MSAGFPRAARVRTRAEYAGVFEQARRTSDPLFSLHWLRTETPARLGLAVSRKVDTRAVVRNRIKRALREQFRQLRPQLAQGDYVVVARAAAAQALPAQLRETFVRTLIRAGALPAAAASGTMPPVAALPPSTDKKKPDNHAG
ncbi:ribonuclease P protein component [Pseudoxanthomonas wuyuanensis]|uniref:Ribonuclease P protein component n=1 Tax=Pseudoxanthomonas wuyuanensis TaxID=1073196 RepID=A0A286DEY0_9GAMM|nr:ribonuclease P protein component [Pseudoxanthomonas wuyuanensis]KAF1719885.1 ribonuclease P protein component [Pseudoxanthomonas wuyuanensis]SOD57119.1 ribonuclease P protein component [Pseudoxanthomonas wuyuanensis]